jgi:alkylhydroperoxidase family enzyme
VPWQCQDPVNFLSRQLSVDVRTRELVIDRVSARCGCDYEFAPTLATA